MKRWTFLTLLFVMGLALLLQVSAQQGSKSKEDKIKNAMSAAPEAIAKDATIVDPSLPEGQQELRKGTNGWTCFPDMANTPVNDPMCLDANALKWAHAWMSQQQPQLDGVGISYMLQGGATADNDDPAAQKPPAGKDWLREPPHLMIFGVKIDPSVHSSEPDTTRPWVMWKGTPYEHLMVPVQ